MSDHDCQRRRVADNDIAAIDVCDCGAIHLHLGAMSVRFTDVAFDALAQLLETARVRRHATLPVALAGWANPPPGQA